MFHGAIAWKDWGEVNDTSVRKVLRQMFEAGIS